MKKTLTILALCLAFNAQAQKLPIDSVLYSEGWEMTNLPDSSILLYQPSMDEMISRREQEIEREIAKEKKEGKENNRDANWKQQIYSVSPRDAYYFDKNGRINKSYGYFKTPLAIKNKVVFAGVGICGTGKEYYNNRSYELNPSKDSITIATTKYGRDIYTDGNGQGINECVHTTIRQYKITIINKNILIFTYNPKTLKITFDEEKCVKAILKRYGGDISPLPEHWKKYLNEK